MLIRPFCETTLRAACCVLRTLWQWYAVRHTKYAVHAIILTTLIVFVAACSEQPPLTPETQLTQGKGLYEAHCASCHEIDQGIGPRLTKQVLATRLSATALFTYNQKNMPYEAGNTLREDEYWAITAYLLNRHGFIEDDVVLNTETAEGLMLTK